MSGMLSLNHYLTAVRSAAARLRDDTDALPADQPVPTCPGWSVPHLIAHVGMVHRWAGGIVRGELTAANSPSETARFEAQGLHADDPGAWLLAGATDLVAALRAAPDDLRRFFFLNNAPPAKLAWARRQCHETTIHAVDGLSARLGRVPASAACNLDMQLAADGIDELLAGFATREGEGLRPESGGTVTVVVDARDVERSWTLRLSDGPMVCEDGATEPQPDARMTGTAAQLYLGLWNRGDEIRQEGADVLDLWRTHMHVEWS